MLPRRMDVGDVVMIGAGSLGLSIVEYCRGGRAFAERIIVPFRQSKCTLV